MNLGLPESQTRPAETSLKVIGQVGYSRTLMSRRADISDIGHQGALKAYRGKGHVNVRMISSEPKAKMSSTFIKIQSFQSGI